jgi:tRNA-dihydrouridine synthase B
VTSIQNIQIYLAPILGHTDYVFRNALAHYFKGTDVFVTPFLTTVKGSCVKNSHLTDILPKYNKLGKIVPQILGKDPEEFLIMANQVCEMGYESINWNLGCPYPMVVNKKRGAGLLPHPDAIREFLSRVMPVMKSHLSIKLRLGKDETEEIFPVLSVINDFPIQEVIIHPRTAKQMYSGTPDLDAFEKCLSACKRPVVYNGDIVDLKSFQVISRRFGGITNFMIGRGLAMNPALSEIIKKGQSKLPEDFFKRLYRFHEDIYRAYREQSSGQLTLLGRMKQLWWYLSYSLKDGEGSLKKIQRSKTLGTYRGIVEELFDSQLNNQPPYNYENGADPR